jgi:hypothetical protein
MSQFAPQQKSNESKKAKGQNIDHSVNKKNNTSDPKENVMKPMLKAELQIPKLD